MKKNVILSEFLTRDQCFLCVDGVFDHPNSYLNHDKTKCHKLSFFTFFGQEEFILKYGEAAFEELFGNTGQDVATQTDDSQEQTHKPTPQPAPVIFIDPITCSIKGFEIGLNGKPQFLVADEESEANNLRVVVNDVMEAIKSGQVGEVRMSQQVGEVEMGPIYQQSEPAGGQVEPLGEEQLPPFQNSHPETPATDFATVERQLAKFNTLIDELETLPPPYIPGVPEVSSRFLN